MTPWLLLAASYLFGALPFGLLIAKWWKGIDVREHGSGNIGATNVLRVVGKPAGVLVFTLDVVKGLWPPLAAQALGLRAEWQLVAGLAAVLGHNFSPFLGFKGGKGVSTSLGLLFGMAWKVGLTAWALWGLVVLLSRFVSLGSIVAAAALTPLTLLFYRGDNVRLALAVVAGLFAIFRHRANIRRLIDGTENRFGKK
jgi:acyl phosphate:glycerol-3-phosphate acyltransferase